MFGSGASVDCRFITISQIPAGLEALAGFIMQSGAINARHVLYM